MLVTVIAFFSAVPTASAHAELLQSSPRAGSVVGGDFHGIRMQFTGLDGSADHDVRLFGPDGQRIDAQVIRDQAVQRLVLSIAPLTVPGEYTVAYVDLLGADGDITDGSFSFRWDPTAPDPEPLTISLDVNDGFDWVALVLLMAAAACLAFLVARFSSALREHRAAQAGAER